MDVAPRLKPWGGFLLLGLLLFCGGLGAFDDPLMEPAGQSPQVKSPDLGAMTPKEALALIGAEILRVRDALPPVSVEAVESMRKEIGRLRIEGKEDLSQLETIGLPLIQNLRRLLLVNESQVTKLLGGGWNMSSKTSKWPRAQKIGLRLRFTYARMLTPDVIKALESMEEIKGLEDQEVEKMFEIIEIRLLVGAKAPQFDPKLHAAIEGHCRDMAELNFFAHESPVPGKKTPADRSRLAGTTGGAENLSMADDPIRAWLLSPGHFSNLLSPSHSFFALAHYQGRWGFVAR